MLRRPRCLFLGNWSSAEVENLEHLVGHARHAQSLRKADSIASAEIDLLLVRGAPAYDWEAWQAWVRGKFVVYVASDVESELPFPHRERPLRLRCRHKEFEVSTEPSELARLAQRSTSEFESAEGLPRWERPSEYLVRDLSIGTWLVRTDEGPCAFHMEGSDRDITRGLLVIPIALCNTVEMSQWVAAALRTWKVRAPETFPRVATWQDSPAWWTPEQRRLEQELAVIHEERAEVLGRLASREADVHRFLDQEKKRAEANELRLVTGQGDDLVDATANALVSLGFSVVVPSEECTSAKAEDLIVTRSEWPNWLASVEVKGFRTSGARLADAAKLSSRRKRRSATQALFIVNGECGLPPEARHVPFQGNADAHDTLLELEVLVIDSRNLYQALSDQGAGIDLVRSMRGDAGVYVPAVSR
jgi:hypothetical protein